MRILALFYGVIGICTLPFVWLGVFVIAMDSKRIDWVVMIVGSAMGVAFILAAIEAWRNTPKTLIGKFLLYGPVVFLLCLLLIKLLNSA